MYGTERAGYFGTAPSRCGRNRKVVTITLTNRFWFTDEVTEGMSDEELIALVSEDLPALVDGAAWTIERKQS